MVPKTLVHVAYKRMLVGYRRGDWKPVYYGQPDNLPYEPDARIKAGSPPGLCLYHTIRAHDDDIKNPTEGEVAWLPFFHPENFESGTAIERKRLQYWFIYRCWQHSTAKNPRDLKNNQFNRPDVPRWHTWREIADGVKRRKRVKKFVQDDQGVFQPYKDDDDDDDDSGYGSMPPSYIPPIGGGARGESALSRDAEHARRSGRHSAESDGDQDMGGRDTGHVQHFALRNKRRRRDSDSTIRPGDGLDANDRYGFELSEDQVNQLNGDMGELEALELASQQSISRQGSMAAEGLGDLQEDDQIRLAQQRSLMEQCSRFGQGSSQDDDDAQLRRAMRESLAVEAEQIRGVLSPASFDSPMFVVDDESDGQAFSNGDSSQDHEGATNDSNDAGMDVSNDAGNTTGEVPDAN